MIQCNIVFYSCLNFCWCLLVFHFTQTTFPSEFFLFLGCRGVIHTNHGERIQSIKVCKDSQQGHSQYLISDMCNPISIVHQTALLSCSNPWDGVSFCGGFFSPSSCTNLNQLLIVCCRYHVTDAYFYYQFLINTLHQCPNLTVTIVFFVFLNCYL